MDESSRNQTQLDENKESESVKTDRAPDSAQQKEPSPEHAAQPRQEGPEKPKKSPLQFRTRLIIIALILAAFFVLAFIVVNHDGFRTFFQGFFAVFAPVLIGVAIAYILNPVYMFFAYTVFKKVTKPRLRQALSIILTYVSFLAVLTVIILLIVPQFISSLTELISNLRTYASNTIKGINSWLNSIYNAASKVRGEPIEFISEEAVEQAINNFFGGTENVLSKVLEWVSRYNQEIISSGRNILSSIYTGLVGLIMSIYCLATKDKRLAQISKFNTAVFSEKASRRIYKIFILSNRSFGGFINGKILDSFIIGILTLIVLLIFRFPYPALIATIIGVTNIIPVLGPFIGAIPTALLVLIVNPSLFLPFILIVLIIQQIDGNIIGPSILGDSVGVSSLCIFAVIVVFGSLFGITGMLIGVPIAAIVVEIVKQYIEHRLRMKKKQTSTVFYYPADTYLDPVRDVDDRTDKLRLRFKAMSIRKQSQMLVKEQNGQPVTKGDRLNLYFLDVAAGNRRIFGKGQRHKHQLFDSADGEISNIFDDEEEIVEIPDAADNIGAQESRNALENRNEILTTEETAELETRLKEFDQKIEQRNRHKNRSNKKQKNQKNADKKRK